MVQPELIEYVSNPLNWMTITTSLLAVLLALARIKDAILKRQYKRLLKIAYEEGLALAQDLRSNAAKREAVVTALRAALPTKFDQAISDQNLEEIAEKAYLLLTKPQIRKMTEKDR